MFYVNIMKVYINDVIRQENRNQDEIKEREREHIVPYNDYKSRNKES